MSDTATAFERDVRVWARRFLEGYLDLGRGDIEVDDVRVESGPQQGSEWDSIYEPSSPELHVVGHYVHDHTERDGSLHRAGERVERVLEYGTFSLTSFIQMVAQAVDEDESELAEELDV